jgi:hypothetical protein
VHIPEEGLALRGTFIINPDGVIKTMEVHSNEIARDVKETLRKLKAAQYTAAHPGEVCPAKWNEGAKTLAPSLDLVGKIYRPPLPRRGTPGGARRTATGPAPCPAAPKIAGPCRTVVQRYNQENTMLDDTLKPNSQAYLERVHAAVRAGGHPGRSTPRAEMRELLQTIQSLRARQDHLLRTDGA